MTSFINGDLVLTGEVIYMVILNGELTLLFGGYENPDWTRPKVNSPGMQN